MSVLLVKPIKNWDYSLKGKVLTVEEALKKAEYFCAYQERCHKEVIEKLKSLGMFETAIDYIMGVLLAENYINEERFAKTFARGKHTYKGWGKRRIEQELKYRDISVFNIQNAFKEIEKDYLHVFYEWADKKWNSLTDSDLTKKKRKWTDYLLRKGYETHLIFERLNDYEKSS